MARRGPICVVSAWVLVVVGCAPVRTAAPAPRPTSRDSVVADGPAARSVKGRVIRSWVYGTGERTVVVLGGIHGSEPAGVPLCGALRDYLAEHPEVLKDRRVIVAPALNPDGLAARTRANARGVDLNRNFETSNRRPNRRHGPRPLSEPESRFIAELIERFRPAAIVTIHQPVTCVDYDGPAAALAGAMSQACGLPVRKLGAMPGSLGSYAGVDMGIPIVTLELPARASRWDGAVLWKHYGDAVLVAIRLTGVE